MEPIQSFQSICERHRLNFLQISLLRSLLERRKGVLHPYWIQLALFMPYEFAIQLYDELIINEWAAPDVVEINDISYETELTDDEIVLLALLN